MEAEIATKTSSGAGRAAKRRPRRPGRPTTVESAELETRLIDAAQAVFTKDGYARATMDGVARAAGITRKTLYARYAGKEPLLDAMIQRLLQLALSPEEAPSSAPADPRAELTALLLSIAQAATQPAAAGLNRLILAEGHLFPDMAQMAVHLQGIAVANVSRALERHAAAGRIRKLEDTILAAQLLIEMATGIPRRNAVLALPQTSREVEKTVRTAVDLFLQGVER